MLYSRAWLSPNFFHVQLCQPLYHSHKKICSAWCTMHNGFFWDISHFFSPTFCFSIVATPQNSACRANFSGVCWKLLSTLVYIYYKKRYIIFIIYTTAQNNWFIWFFAPQFLIFSVQRVPDSFDKNACKDIQNPCRRLYLIVYLTSSTKYCFATVPSASFTFTHTS